MRPRPVFGKHKNKDENTKVLKLLHEGLSQKRAGKEGECPLMVKSVLSMLSG